MTDQEYRNVVSNLVGSDKVYSKDVAQQLCDMLTNAEIDDWTYVPERQNTEDNSVFHVVAYDSDNHFAGYF
jgi:hypothetical protein